VQDFFHQQYDSDPTIPKGDLTSTHQVYVREFGDVKLPNFSSTSNKCHTLCHLDPSVVCRLKKKNLSSRNCKQRVRDVLHIPFSSKELYLHSTSFNQIFATGDPLCQFLIRDIATASHICLPHDLIDLRRLQHLE